MKSIGKLRSVSNNRSTYILDMSLGEQNEGIFLDNFSLKLGRLELAK